MSDLPYRSPTPALLELVRKVVADYDALNARWESAGPVVAGGPTEMAFRVQMVDLFGRCISELRQELPPAGVTSKPVKWAILDENGKLFGPFDESLFARDWFERRTSLTAGRYVVLPLEAP